MTFARANWSRQSSSINTGKDSTGQNGPAIFSYQHASDVAATIIAANYFADAVYDLAVGDLMFINAADAFVAVRVATIDREAETITVESIGLNDAIDTANIVNDAVTTAKIADAAVTSAKLAEGLVQRANVTMTIAQLLGMYVTPYELVAAPGAGKKIIPLRITVNVDYGGTVLADGGAIHAQYDTTTLGAGTKATNTFAAASIIAITADSSFGFTPVDTAVADATSLNKSLTLSNATAAFTGGDASAYIVDTWYAVADYT